MKNVITNYQNTLYLNGAALSGVISADASYTLSYEPLNAIGKGFLKNSMSSPPEVSFSFSRHLTQADPIFSFTGNGPGNLSKRINGGIYYEGKFLGFQDGYLSSVGIECSVGEIPTINNTISVYGDIGSNFNPEGIKKDGLNFVPQVKDIQLQTKNSSTNRITSFSIDYTIEKNVIYGISSSSSELPIEVQNVLPIEVVASFVLEIDDYESKRAFEDLSSSNTSSFSINISPTLLEDRGLEGEVGFGANRRIENLEAVNNELLLAFEKFDNPSIFNFSASDAVIISEQISSTSDDVMSVNLTYKTYLN